MFATLAVECVFSDKSFVKGLGNTTTERLYTEAVTALQAGSSVINSSINQKETFKSAG